MFMRTRDVIQSNRALAEIKAYKIAEKNKKYTCVVIGYIWLQKSVEYTARGRCTWTLLKSVAVAQEVTILPLELNKTTRRHEKKFFLTEYIRVLAYL